MDSGPTLEVSDLRRAFGGLVAVDRATFTVARGTITGLIGPNGAGKSTVVALITGALAPGGGAVKYEGVPITGLAPHTIARKGIIRTFQLPSQFSRLTVLENMMVAAPNQPGRSLTGAIRGRRHWRRRETEILDTARHLLARFSLEEKENEYAGSLSGGQRRLLELARALMTEPRLLLLDEPTVGVSPTLARDIERHLSELRSEGKTILMVEHELDIVGRLCDSVIVMARGQVISTGTMSEIRQRREVVDAYIAG